MKFLGFSWLATGYLLLLSLASCSSRPDKIVLSSGIANGYYNRLGEQIRDSADAAVNLPVENQDSQGSQQNLTRLLNRQTDMALVQLDVASNAMRHGKVQAIALLANEHVHLITRQDTRLNRFTDLQGRRVAIGAPGSGIHHTASQLLQAARLKVQPDSSDFDEALNRLRTRRVDAVIYVGRIGASDKLRQQFDRNPTFRLIPIQTSLANYLTVRNPSAYQAALIPAGTYRAHPPLPPQNIPTLSTATVVVTRPDVSRQKVGLLTWSILSTSRKYSPFYPELQIGDARSLLQKGLFYLHPAAADVYEQGDPRNAWVRYWENNSDLQAGLVILIGTSSAGLFLRHWRRERSKKLMGITSRRVAELKELLPQEAQQALRGVEELRQEHRVMFIDGAITTDIYEQVQQKTQMFADQCRELLEQQRKKLVLDTLLLLDDWQATLQTNPEEALKKLTQIKQQYREMLLADQVDIDAYIELVELTLISLMTLTPQSQPRVVR